MKPPSRQRSAPARYRTAPTSQAWTDPEKRRLLRALRAHGQGPLRPELLKKYLPSRDEEEIMAFVEHLKERVAKEAVKEQYQYRQRKQKDAPIPAPIEIWTELAEKLTGPLEDAVATAFSQVWTIASTEPLTLLHSVPPKSVVIKDSQCSSQNLHSESRKSDEESHEPTVSSNVEEIAPAENSGFHVDFEKIYKYLSVISRGCKAPELPPCESAVVLDLLLSLPEELGFLDFKKLKSHMHKCYTELNTHYTGERSRIKEGNQPVNNNGELFPHVQPATSGLPQQEESSSSPTTSKDDATSASAMDWKTLGICPLNPFLFPLAILARKEESFD
uniref:Small nuclear RNA activating complex polypeptide 2 n=1 Tax=Podarcis muralis TaxID=64176 RepID=A0A670J2M4_PODMU|nr:snRNA-activating protein complex subunit 2 isoform X1 [Podarcis muralis]XP_028589643.1 snRNA-activating protein complex subunit 2 isoform X1 [Podarcis muralis]